MPIPLDGQVAIVTGAGGGLGRAQAIALACAGATVIAFDLNPETSADTATAIAEAGGKGQAVSGDITDAPRLRAQFAQFEQEHGRIDILVNNAGLGGGQEFESVTEDMFDEMFRVNTKGPFFAAQAVVPGMKRRRHGRIVNVSSLVALRGTAHSPHYGGSKAALIGFARCWALELAPYKICVNTVVPSFMATPMAQSALGAQEIARRGAANPMGRLAEPEDVARLVVFLAGPQADFVTGQTISANGGDYVGAM